MGLRQKGARGWRHRMGSDNDLPAIGEYAHSLYPSKIILIQKCLDLWAGHSRSTSRNPAFQFPFLICPLFTGTPRRETQHVIRVLSLVDH